MAQKCFNVPNRLVTGEKRKKPVNAYFGKPVKGMLSAIRQSNYRILNVRRSKKHYCLPEKEMEKPPDGITDGLKRSGSGKCMSAVFKPIKGAKKKHFKIIY
ncbi:hypothetical protein GGTG_10371 [Gaeumannomyces tritici R3-111a-1]|uniref:Uncharacterized protein n=1 Tax=Gaeumannomyces tritici (strain R3-111a-1) TaxID=644352 RepID=J3PA46_GAET3|nr:hypothetical protein GGTG_10371 [Gaeumannomyces tritici R3-111a-1]EJT71111.1 hypothetical protein GGTG_10371 [Gaeumannomyces tritici R3-111a-1]